MTIDYTFIAVDLSSQVIDLLPMSSDSALQPSDFASFIQLCFAINTGSALYQEREIRNWENVIKELSFLWITALADTEGIGRFDPECIIARAKRSFYLLRGVAFCTAALSGAWLYAMWIKGAETFLCACGIFSPIIILPNIIYLLYKRRLYQKLSTSRKKYDQISKKQSDDLLLRAEKHIASLEKIVKAKQGRKRCRKGVRSKSERNGKPRKY